MKSLHNIIFEAESLFFIKVILTIVLLDLDVKLFLMPNRIA